MAGVFAQAARERRAHGQFAYATFLLKEYAGLTGGSLLARDLSAAVPVFGGAVAAAVLHGALYTSVCRVLRAGASALRDASMPVSDPLTETLTISVFGIASLLPLLPLFLLLSIRLTWRSR